MPFGSLQLDFVAWFGCLDLIAFTTVAFASGQGVEFVAMLPQRSDGGYC